MHRPLCVALASALALLPAPPALAAPDSAHSRHCTAAVSAHRFERGDAAFNSALAFLLTQGPFPASGARFIAPSAASAIDVQVEAPATCSDQPSRAAAAACTAPSCVAATFAPESLAPGTQLSMQTCSERLRTAIAWTAGAANAWQLVRVQQDLVEACPPAG